MKYRKQTPFWNTRHSCISRKTRKPRKPRKPRDEIFENGPWSKPPPFSTLIAPAACNSSWGIAPEFSRHRYRPNLASANSHRRRLALDWAAASVLPFLAFFAQFIPKSAQKSAPELGTFFLFFASSESSYVPSKLGEKLLFCAHTAKTNKCWLQLGLKAEGYMPSWECQSTRVHWGGGGYSDTTSQLNLCMPAWPRSFLQAQPKGPSHRMNWAGT